MYKKISILFSFFLVFEAHGLSSFIFGKSEQSCHYGPNVACDTCYNLCKNDPLTTRVTCNARMIHCCNGGIFKKCPYMDSNHQFYGSDQQMGYNQMPYGGYSQQMGYNQMGGYGQQMSYNQMPYGGQMDYNQMPYGM